MGLEALANLLRIGQLKAEPRNDAKESTISELCGLVPRLIDEVEQMTRQDTGDLS